MGSGASVHTRFKGPRPYTGPLDPHKRLTMGDALQHPYFSGRQLVVGDAMEPAGRGLATLLYGELEKKLTAYLQADPYWETLYKMLSKRGRGNRKVQKVRKGQVQNVGKKEKDFLKRRSVFGAAAARGRRARAGRSRRAGG